jgi:drug/metabolite transporter (DMT)-like permease
MLVGAMLSGERLSRLQWVGLVVAISGLSYLLVPGLEAPPLVGASLMLMSGVAWGIYSLRGQSGSVAHHFLLAVPLAALLNLAVISDVRVTSAGFLVAVISGAVTSGIGYAIWFRALKTLSGAVAATVQLAVPVIAAFGGAWFLSEPLTMRLVIAAIIVLTGIALTLTKPSRWQVPWRDVVAHPSASRVQQ